MIFNINYSVKVQLTSHGKSILYSQFRERHAQNPKAFPTFSLPKEDEDGWSEWALWSLMNTFGDHIWLGCEAPFNLEIEIPEKR